MSRFLKPLAPALAGTAAVLSVAYGVSDRLVHRADAPERVAQITGPQLVTPAQADGHEEDGPGPMPGDLSREGGYGLGREALPEEIAAWNIDVRPDGQGLPKGSGDVWTGEEIWIEKCSTCHGDFGEGSGRWPVLAGGKGTLDRKDPVKTVGSYWPYLSTLVDYVHRAMPFGNAQSLEADEVYALSAYILYLNNVVADDFVLSDESFAEVTMPNADGFFMDDRAETELEPWRREPCMENCKDSVEITMRARVLDVTPDSGDDAAESGDDATTPAEEVAEEEEITTEAIAEAETGDVGQDENEAPDPELVAAGEKVFRQCQACHMVGDGAANRTGPVLNGVVGRQAGSFDGFRYSPALSGAGEEGLVWTEETLAEFLADPRAYVKGNRMSFRGLRDEHDIEAIIAFLESHGR